MFRKNGQNGCRLHNIANRSTEKATTYLNTNQVRRKIQILHFIMQLMLQQTVNELVKTSTVR